MPRRTNSYVALLAATLPLSSCSLALTGPTARHVPSSHAPMTPRAFAPLPPASPGSYASRKSPLFVASAESRTANSDIEDARLKQIEKKIERYNKKQQKYLDRVKKTEDRLNALQTTKQQYLEGIKLGEPPAGGNFSETTVRSAVKAMMWRVIAGTVTLITSLRFSGSLSTALSIVGSDFFSKALTMFIGERLMNKSQAGRDTGADNAGRSLMKALIWRVFAICNTLTMSLIISKDLSMASKIAGSDAVFKTGLMFVYERVWAKIEWGKEYLIEFSI